MLDSIYFPGFITRDVEGEIRGSWSVLELNLFLLQPLIN
jgi:hypothetical protein